MERGKGEGSMNQYLQAVWQGFRQPFREIVRMWCWLTRHKWRRARKGEDTGLKYCRCGATRQVKRRKA